LTLGGEEARSEEEGGGLGAEGATSDGHRVQASPAEGYHEVLGLVLPGGPPSPPRGILRVTLFLSMACRGWVSAKYCK
jgi:hypothetical protein